MATRAKIQPDGTIGEWENQTKLNPDRSHHAAFIREKRIYMVGGLTGDPVGNQAVSHDDCVYADIDDQGKLVGCVALREVLLAEPTTPLSSLAKPHPAPLHPQDSASRAAELAAKYKLLSLPVQSEDGKLLGVVTVDDVLEHTLGG